MAKIKDVAKLANVSPSTVSLVLNNKGYVSEATRAKVQAAVTALNYVPSEVARNLSLNRTNLIGVIIPDIAHPFFAILMHEIEIALYRYGYRTMICSTSEKENAELVFLDMLRRHTMDGLIVGAHALHLESYEGIDLPIVAFDRFINDNIPIVRADHSQGGSMAAKALLARKPKHRVAAPGSSHLICTAAIAESSTPIHRITKSRKLHSQSLALAFRFWGKRKTDMGYLLVWILSENGLGSLPSLWRVQPTSD